MDPTPHLKQFHSYEEACREFRWALPQQLNVAKAICQRHADAVTRIALHDVKDGGINTYTFGGLDFLSDKFATVLSEAGLTQGDAIALALPPSAAQAVAHLAALKSGAVVIPLSISSGATTFERVISESRSRALVIDESGYDLVEGLTGTLPDVEVRFVVSDLRPTAKSFEVKDFWTKIDSASSEFEAVETDIHSAAFVFYIDLEGQITGVVHSHRSVVSQLAAFEMATDVDSDSARQPANDWCSPGVVLGFLYPSWWYGRPVVAGNSRDSGFKGIRLGEVYGRPETGLIFGKCERWFSTPAGSVGRPVPGRSIEIVDENGNVVRPGQTGQIAVHKSDPGLFTEYHGMADRTDASFIGDWFLTRDVGQKNGHGDYFIEP